MSELLAVSLGLLIGLVLFCLFWRTFIRGLILLMKVGDKIDKAIYKRGRR